MLILLPIMGGGLSILETIRNSFGLASQAKDKAINYSTVSLANRSLSRKQLSNLAAAQSAYDRHKENWIARLEEEGVLVEGKLDDKKLAVFESSNIKNTKRREEQNFYLIVLGLLSEDANQSLLSRVNELVKDVLGVNAGSGEIPQDIIDAAIQQTKAAAKEADGVEALALKLAARQIRKERYIVDFESPAFTVALKKSKKLILKHYESISDPNIELDSGLRMLIKSRANSPAMLRAVVELAYLEDNIHGLNSLELRGTLNGILYSLSNELGIKYDRSNPFDQNWSHDQKEQLMLALNERPVSKRRPTAALQRELLKSLIQLLPEPELVHA